MASFVLFNGAEHQDKWVPRIVNAVVAQIKSHNILKTFQRCSNQIVNNPIRRFRQRSVSSFILSRCITGVTRSPLQADVTSVALLKSLRLYILDALLEKACRLATRLIRLAQRMPSVTWHQTFCLKIKSCLILHRIFCDASNKPGWDQICPPVQISALFPGLVLICRSSHSLLFNSNVFVLHYWFIITYLMKITLPGKINFKKSLEIC